MKIKWISYLILTCFSIATAGCGYTSRSLLPPEMNSIHVDNFSNAIDLSREISDRRENFSYRPGLETDITKEVINGFIFYRRLDVKSKNEAALLLKGALIDFRQSPLSYDDNDNVEEFRIELFVNVELYDNNTGELIWKERNFMGESNYTIAGPNAKTETQALRSAVKDLSQRIVERVVDAWYTN